MAMVPAALRRICAATDIGPGNSHCAPLDASIVEELYTDTQPQRRNFVFETCTGIIKIKHIAGVPWASSEFIAHLGKIPANVRATIKQRFRSEFW